MDLNRVFGRLRATCLLQLLILLPLSQGAAQVRRLMPVPDLPGFRTLKCDFHLHTVVSDGEVWPTVRVAEAWRDGLDAIAITDHAAYNPHKDDLKPDCARAIQLARPVAERLGIILVPGIELAEQDIHFNALFVTEANALMSVKLIDGLRLAREQNAFAFWNHPGWKQTAQWFPEVAEAFDHKLFQGLELVNGPEFYPEAFPWMEKKKLTILANSDAHGPVPAGTTENPRPMTLVFARTVDESGIHEALSAGRTAAWMGGEVWGAENLLRGLWEGAISRSDLTLRPGGPSVALRLTNSSAIPFQLRLRQAPDWLRAPSGQARLPAQSAIALSLAATKGTPPGSQNVEVVVELLNFHVGPGKNLSVPLRLKVTVLE